MREVLIAIILGATFFFTWAVTVFFNQPGLLVLTLALFFSFIGNILLKAF